MPIHSSSGADDWLRIGCAVVLGVVLCIGGVAAWLGWQAWVEQQVHGELLFWRSCPFSAELVGKHPPDGRSQWCQAEAPDGSYKRHGIAREWHENGQLQSAGAFVWGQRDGEWRYFDEEGRLEQLGFFNLGRRHGTWQEWYPSGRLKRDIHFTANELDGTWQWLADDGRTLSAGRYAGGKRDGYWDTWLGEVRQEDWYANDIVQRSKLTYASGVVRFQKPVRNGLKREVLYSGDGKIFSFGVLRDGHRDGAWVYCRTKTVVQLERYSSGRHLSALEQYGADLEIRIDLDAAAMVADLPTAPNALHDAANERQMRLCQSTDAVEMLQASWP